MIVKTLSSSIKSVEVKKDEIVFETEPYSTLARYLGEKSNATKQLLQEQANVMRRELLKKAYVRLLYTSCILTGINASIVIAATAGIGLPWWGPIILIGACVALYVAQAVKIVWLYTQPDDSFLQRNQLVCASVHKGEDHIVSQFLNTDPFASAEYKKQATKRRELKLTIKEAREAVCSYRDEVERLLSYQGADDDKALLKNLKEQGYISMYTYMDISMYKSFPGHRNYRNTEECPTDYLRNKVNALDHVMRALGRELNYDKAESVRASLRDCRGIHKYLRHLIVLNRSVDDENVAEFHEHIETALRGLDELMDQLVDDKLYRHMFGYWYTLVSDDSSQAVQARSFMDAAVLLRLARIEELILQAPDCDKASDFSKCNAEKFVRNEAKLLLEELQKHSESYHNMLAAMRAIDSATSSKQDLSVPDVELSAEKILQGMIDNQLQRALQHLSSPSTTPTTPKGA